MIVEGEPAADALQGALVVTDVGAGVFAGDRQPLVVGTVTGASSAPSVDVLTSLQRFRSNVGTRHLRENERGRVYLWPDNDDNGDKHMQRVGKGLLAAGVEPAAVRLIEWPEAPPKGDAADWAAAGCTPTFRELLESAAPFEPPKRGRAREAPDQAGQLSRTARDRGDTRYGSEMVAQGGQGAGGRRPEG